MRILFLLFIYGLSFTSAKYKITRDWVSQSKQPLPLPFFRRNVEEIYDDNSSESKQNDQRSKLIAFLIKNVEEVFKDTDINLLNEFAENLEPITTENLVDKARLSATTFSEDSQRKTIFINENHVVLYENGTIHSMPFLITVPSRTPIKKLNKVTKRAKVEVSDNLSFIETPIMLIDDNILGLHNVTQSIVHLEELPTRYYVMDDQVQTLTPELKRSCIQCNNVAVPECASPENKLQVHNF